ncbi:adiponectin receptor protein-like [Tubulanus polymorphus]|uniref:adiponectin receptor protein-like n=1 Tax=Tubulanus polymorphus TaxID=672921 RepID=UPI003DA2E5E2
MDLVGGASLDHLPDPLIMPTSSIPSNDNQYKMSAESSVNDSSATKATTSAEIVNEDDAISPQPQEEVEIQEEAESMLKTPVKDEHPKSIHAHNVEILAAAHRAAEQVEEFAKKIWRRGWEVVHHHHLPDWLKDNDFLHRGHRPELNSFMACFKSIFRIHTETGNIWTHLLGFIAFIGVAVYFLSRSSIEVQWQEKAVFSAFFAGAILCLGFSWIFHTVYCHSERVGKLFNKLDYCGIALLTMGSFVPWLYYSFYCSMAPKIAYLVLIFILGTTCIIVSLWDKFSEPQYRCVRAGVFIALGLSGVIPAMHYVITEGFSKALEYAALGWLVLMAFLYILGALIYACRFPERMFPGKFDIWFQSHQIFHIFVVAAAFVHYHGITEIANYRLTSGDCVAPEVE